MAVKRKAIYCRNRIARKRCSKVVATQCRIMNPVYVDDYQYRQISPDRVNNSGNMACNKSSEDLFI